MSIASIAIHPSVEAVFPAERLQAELDGRGLSVAVIEDDPDALEGYDALVTMAHRDWFLESEGLEWIHSIQAGVDRFPFEAFRERDVILTNSSGIHDDSVGEMVVGYMLMFARRLAQFTRQQPAHRWDRPDWDEPFTLVDQAVCIVGLGALGRGIAARADALGMVVSGVKRTVEPVPHVETVYASSGLQEAIADVRFVAIATPLTDETHHLFSVQEFELMRDDAYLMNVARGAVVDEDALVEALRTDAIAGAGLDVFEEEPLPEDSPLWDMDEVIISPHAAGASEDYYRRVAAIVMDNVEHIATGEALRNRVV